MSCNIKGQNSSILLKLKAVSVWFSKMFDHYHDEIKYFYGFTKNCVSMILN